jgi:predicted PurR-regulated permease PerM
LPLTAPQRQTLGWTAVGLLLLAVLAVLGPVLSPFAAAAVLAYVLQPGVAWLQQRRVPRPVGATLVLLVAALALVAVILILVPIVQVEVVQIRQRLPALAQTITERLLPWLREVTGLELTVDAAAIRAWLTRHLASAGEDWAAALFGYVRSGWSAAIEVLGLLFLVPVLAWYLLTDWPGMIARLGALVPPRWRQSSASLLGEIDALLGQYLRGQLLVMLALAAYYALALLAGGYSLWLPIGVLTGLLVAIPYLGFALGAAFALLTGMLELGPLRGLAVTAIVYGLGQVLESFILTPRLIGERIGLHPLAVILALMAFGALFGFVGVLLALPLAAMAAVGLRRLHGTYLASEFYRRPR